MPARRIAAITAKEFRGLMRDRLPYCIGLFALLWGLALRIVPPVAAGAGDKILIDVGVGAIGLLSALVVAFTGAEVMARDIERRTVLLVLSQPISRAALVLGKHAGLVSVAIALVAAMALLYWGGLSLAGVAYPLGSLSVALAFLVLGGGPGAGRVCRLLAGGAADAGRVRHGACQPQLARVGRAER